MIEKLPNWNTIYLKSFKKFFKCIEIKIPLEISNMKSNILTRRCFKWTLIYSKFNSIYTTASALCPFVQNGCDILSFHTDHLTCSYSRI